MGDWAACNGQRVVSARVSIPYYGAWTADIMLAAGGPIDPRVSLVFGDLQLSGYAVRQGSYAGSWTARIVAGNGGWRKLVPAQGYNSSAGITKRLLLEDASALVDEAVIVGTDEIVGTMWLRENAPASRLLRQLAGSLWWQDFQGVTQVGVPRDASDIGSKFDVIDADPARGRYLIGTEVLSDWTPGRMFTSATVVDDVTIGSVSHIITDDGTHRIEVLSADKTAQQQVGQPTPLDRFSRSFRELVRMENPTLTFLGLWEYVVQSATATTVDAVPIDDASDHLPEIVQAPLLPSILGENVTFKAGAICTVMFVNGNPARPVVIGGDYSNPPTLGKLMGGGKGAARGAHSGVGPTLIATGDPVDCGSLILHGTPAGADFLPGTINFGYYAGGTLESIITAALAAAQAIDPTAVRGKLTGKISDGSLTLQIGG